MGNVIFMEIEARISANCKALGEVQEIEFCLLRLTACVQPLVIIIATKQYKNIDYS